MRAAGACENPSRRRVDVRFWLATSRKLLQEFSHELERRLAVSPRLNEDVQNLAFAVHGAPDVQLSAVDGDEHFIEMPPPVRPRPSSSQPARNDPAEL